MHVTNTEKDGNKIIQLKIDFRDKIPGIIFIIFWVGLPATGMMFAPPLRIVGIVIFGLMLLLLIYHVTYNVRSQITFDPQAKEIEYRKWSFLFPKTKKFFVEEIENVQILVEDHLWFRFAEPRLLGSFLNEIGFATQIFEEFAFWTDVEVQVGDEVGCFVKQQNIARRRGWWMYMNDCPSLLAKFYNYTEMSIMGFSTNQAGIRLEDRYKFREMSVSINLKDGTREIIYLSRDLKLIGTYAFAEEISEQLQIDLLDESIGDQVIRKPGTTDMYIGERYKDTNSVDVAFPKTNLVEVSTEGSKTILRAPVNDLRQSNSVIKIFGLIFLLIVYLLVNARITRILDIDSWDSLGGATANIIIAFLIYLFARFGLRWTFREFGYSIFEISPTEVVLKRDYILFKKQLDKIEDPKQIERIERFSSSGYWKVLILTDEQYLEIPGAYTGAQASELRKTVISMFVGQ